MDFIVDFNNWVFRDYTFHEDRGISQLKNAYGNKCCLGFCTEQILPGIRMIGISNPVNLMHIMKLYPSNYANIMREALTGEAIEINDNVAIPWRQKILFLQLHFSIFDHTITFINVPPVTN